MDRTASGSFQHTEGSSEEAVGRTQAWLPSAENLLTTNDSQEHYGRTARLAAGKLEPEFGNMTDSEPALATSNPETSAGRASANPSETLGHRNIP